MKRNILVMTAVVVIAALLAGCPQNDNNDSKTLNDNTTDKSTASKQLIEPCQLITKAEAEELIGEAMMDAEKSEKEVVGNKLCFYESLDEDSERFLQVGITQQAFIPNDEVTPKSLYESIKENFKEELTEVDGIGDEAFIATPGIHILNGEYYIVIAVGNSSNETNRGILIAAGKRAVENLELQET